MWVCNEQNPRLEETLWDNQLYHLKHCKEKNKKANLYRT